MDYYNYGIPNIPTPAIQTNGTGQQPPLPQYGYQLPQVPQQNCPLDNRFAWIPSKDMARTTPMAPDKTILFLDENESYAYLRKTDRDGKTTEFRIFKLEEEKEQSPELIQNETVTRSEFETLSKNLDSSINELKDMILGLNNKQNYNKNYKEKAGEH